ncbi:MAG: Flp pilus assembly protein CpaB [Acetobacteraceae bacterium]|nr:Flp pilus assembly protein CpaB [Acetobacteraceae bacterium]
MIRMLLGTMLLLGAGFLAWMSFQDDGVRVAVAAPPAVTKILVAAQPIQAGTLLKDLDFKEREVPIADVKPADLVATENSRVEIRGAMLRQYLEAGQTIHREDILRPRDRGFLASVLAAGTRAISIGVDATTGASGLISPGDLVDIILIQEFARGETAAGRRVVAETVLSRVRVIAVDQQIAQGAPTSNLLQNVTPSNRVASNVSLQVTPEQAAKIVVAGQLGRLTLTVRSIDGDQPADAASSNPTKPAEPGSGAAPAPLPTSVFGSDVSSALSSENSAPSPKMRLIQGDAVSDLVFH